jgi:unspecific monooxygenase
MRLHPPAPILYREVERDFELSGFEFARDVAVWVSPELLHKDPRYFPEPHRFLPERFMKPGLMAPSAYLPFGAGPRACIGSYLALLQMAITTVLMARRFVLTPTASQGFRVRSRTDEVTDYVP